jgi:PIN domain nuclease of toxin-antitoxin system
VNLAEVASAFVEEGVPIDDVRRRLIGLPLHIVPFEGEQVFEAARLRRLTHHGGLSLADRACLALARLRNAPVLTTDRAWRSLKVGVDVRLIR